MDQPGSFEWMAHTVRSASSVGGAKNFDGPDTRRKRKNRSKPHYQKASRSQPTRAPEPTWPK